MVRSVNVELLTENIKKCVFQANHFLAPDMDKAMRTAHERETKPLAKQILGQLLENLDIAGGSDSYLPGYRYERLCS